MADKIHPTSKPTTSTTPLFPPNKAQLYNSSTTTTTTRPLYRQPPRRRRTFCCSFCLCITFSFILLLLISALSATAFYLIYRPHRPSFSISSLQISKFNLTSSNQLNTNLNFTLTARNPNKKISFYFDSVSVKIESRGIDVGDGTIPAFVMNKKNTTRLRSVISTSGKSLEDDDDNGGLLRSDLKNKRRFPLTIRLDTKVKVKVGSVKTKRVPIRVVCKGITAVAPVAGKAVTTAAVNSGVKCKVDLRIKIWKWTV